MAELDKNEDRESWVRIAIQFARRGILVRDSTIPIHGPHDSTNNMWGEFEGTIGASHWWSEFEFSAKSNGSMYRPFKFRVRDKDSKELFPIVKVSALDSKTTRWMRAAKSTLAKLETKRRESGQ